MKNNKGYSLVELVIAFALLMLISASVVAFLRVSSHAYYSVSSGVNLQVRSQVAVTQLQNYIIDCNRGIYFDDSADTLYVVNYEDGDYVAHTFNLNNNTLYYEKRDVDIPAGGSPGLAAASAGEKPVFARDVSTFSVSAVSPASVTLTLVLSRNGKTQESVQTISLRNRPSTAPSLSDLLDAVCVN